MKLYIIFLVIIFLFLILQFYILFFNKLIYKKYKNNQIKIFKEINVSFNKKEKEIFFLNFNKVIIKRNILSKKIISGSLNNYLKNINLGFSIKNIYKSTIWIKEKNINFFCSNKYLYLISENKSKKYVYKYSQIFEINYINRKKILISFKNDIKNKPIFIKFNSSKELLNFNSFIFQKKEEI